MMNRWYLDSSTLMRVQSGAFCWQGDIEAVNYYMNKVASEIFSFLMLGEKQVKVSRKDIITVSFWDLWLSSQKAMKSVPTGKEGLEDMMQSLLQGAFQRKE